MNGLEAELDTTASPVPVHILGINAAGEESGNDGLVAGRVIPWLQDTEQEDVWHSWQVTWRDVIILDRHNEVFAIYNLTTYNLAIPAHRDTLRAWLLRAAQKE